MRLAFFVNQVGTEEPRFTTTLLARRAVERGHEVFYLGVDDFLVPPDDGFLALARRAPADPGSGPEPFLAGLQDDAAIERLDVASLDVLLLRNDPAADAERPWAQPVGINFGQFAVRCGVLVLNDPIGLAKATSKLYFQYFPAEIRPRTMVGRDREAIGEFIDELGGRAILKPIQGSGGRSVFLVRPEDAQNRNQMIEAVLRDGYVIVQEYLPEAAEGDIRLFLVDGRPLEVDGRIAALRRVSGNGDLRSNMSVGGKAVRAEIGAAELRIAELARPQVVRDGLFLVGLDIAADRILEVNVFSPGGLGSAGALEERDFAGAVLDSIERKVAWRGRAAGVLTNSRLACL